MNIDVTMPQLGETVAEGTVTRWLRQVGELIADQEPLVEIATDKVDTELPSPGAGRLLQILVPEDETVPVGALLAVIGAESGAESTPSGPVPAEPTPAEPTPAEPTPSGPAIMTPVATPPADPITAVPAVVSNAARAGRRQQHSPRVRRLAGEAGLCLADLVGSGPGGRVTPADVHRAARSVEPQPEAVRVDARSENAPVQNVVPSAAAHGTSQASSVIEVDVSSVLALLRERQSAGSATLLALAAKAVLEAFRALDLPEAVKQPSTGRGLGLRLATVPDVAVLRDAGDLNLLGLARRMTDLITRAEAGSLTPDERAGASVVIGAADDVLFDIPQLGPGQLAALSVGAPSERPTIARTDGAEPVIAIRSISHLALSYDPARLRNVDAVRLLRAVKSRLETGQFQHEFA